MIETQPIEDPQLVLTTGGLLSLWGKVKKKAKKVWKKVKNTVKKAVRIAKEVANRLLGLLDFLGSLFGILPLKYLRLRIYVLSDGGTAVADVNDVGAWLETAQAIFKKRLNVEIRPHYLSFPFIKVLPQDAPGYALNPPSAGQAGAGGFSDAADYFEDLCDYTATGAGSWLADAIGYGEPFYAFVVDQVQHDKAGAYYGWGARYCVLSNDAKRTSLTHELGHACGLVHSKAKHNLMNPDRLNPISDSELTRLQIAVMRNSRFIVMGARRG